MKTIFSLAAALSISATASFAQTAPCGGNFNAFMQQVGQEARSQGLPQNAINAVISAARQDPKVLPIITRVVIRYR